MSQPSPAPRHLVWLSAVTWDFPLVGRTRMLTEALLSRGHPTTFVAIPSYRTALQRLGTKAAHPCVVRPWPLLRPMSLWPGLTSSRIERAVARPARALRRELEGRLDLASAVAIVVSPIWAPWLESLGFGTVIYDCIDDIEVMTPRPEVARLYRAWENELLQRSAGVVFASTALRDRSRDRCVEARTRLIHNGVDAEAFQRAARESPRPDDLPNSGRRPLVGFVGALYDWVDAELIGEVADRIPEFDFLIVGPERSAIPFPRRPNTYYLGHRPYQSVPAYMQACDVCWLPFRHNDVTTAADPVKLYEYLSLGKPVVATKVLEPEAFEGLVRVGEGAESMAQLLRSAVGSSPADARQRRAFAERNTWLQRLDDLVEFVDTLELSGSRPGTPAPPQR